MLFLIKIITGSIYTKLVYSSNVAKKYSLELDHRSTVYKTGVLISKNFLLTFVLTCNLHNLAETIAIE